VWWVRFGASPLDVVSTLLVGGDRMPWTWPWLKLVLYASVSSVLVIALAHRTVRTAADIGRAIAFATIIGTLLIVGVEAGALAIEAHAATHRIFDEPFTTRILNEPHSPPTSHALLEGRSGS
jgi:hypothetical protein